MAYQAIQGPSSGSSSSSGFQLLTSPFGDTTYTKVFVGGLAWETQSETMRRYFEQFGRVRPASPFVGSLQPARGAYVGGFGYQQPLSYGYQQGLVYPPYGYTTYGPEYIYPQSLYNPYMGQQYLQIYGVPGAVNTTIYPYGQLGQSIPSGHGYTAMQGYTVPGHQIVPYGGSNVNAITTSPMPAIQAPYPSGIAAPVPGQPQFLVPASPQFMQGSGPDQTAGSYIVMLTKLCLSHSRWQRKLEHAGCFSIWTFTLVYLYLILPELRKSDGSIGSMGVGIAKGTFQNNLLLKQPPPVKPEAPLPEPKVSADANVVPVPSHSRWFSWDSIHQCEVRHLPEFFDSSSSKNPRVYKYYRNSIVKYFRYNPNRKITFTDVRKTLVGDVGSIRRVFDFLEAWGLINYHSSTSFSKPFKWDDKETKPDSASESSAPIRETAKRVCSGCKALCTIACFACDKYDLTLCARCYVRGNYRVGVSSSDFRRVEISEETKTEWNDKETMSLLDAITHFGDDWKRVSQHVVGRTEKECVTHFLKLPFGDQFLHYQQHSALTDDSCNQVKEKAADAECESETVGSAESSKRMRLTPLADASNPIMAQAAFLSALAGSEVAQAAAQAALTTLSDVYKATRINYRSLPRNTLQQDAGVASNGDNTSDSFQRSLLHANTQLEKEESDVEKAISEIIDVQMKNILDKLVHFEDSDLLMEKESQQLEQMKNMFFLDQLTLLFHKSSAPKTGECPEGNHVKTNG
ncbi:Winged helix-like DNA-binding domain superfamily [Sesbania bispinosa]|nr:Winged helix-like DNA-binding domain superfamily [Sesbania bispinosa]